MAKTNHLTSKTRTTLLPAIAPSIKNNKTLQKQKLNIPTLSPIIFRKNHIKNNTDELLNDDSITQFFIHSFKEHAVNLKLPLDKTMVNDFVFITNGSMTQNLGIESFELKKNDFLFTPKNSITTTEFVFCRFGRLVLSFFR